MRGFRDRVEVAEVLRLLNQRLCALPVEEVGLHEAGGRVLGRDLVAGVDVPGFDRAAMDGHAVRGEDTFGASAYSPVELRVVGEARPGQAFLEVLKAGEAVRIMTGAPLPDGADAVVPAELSREREEMLEVFEPIAPWRHVGRRGEDIKLGQKVLQRGRVLRPQDVGVLAAIGQARVPVIRQPRTDLFVTGNELLPVGSAPCGYRIVDSNSVMLEALVKRDGGVPQLHPILSDDRHLIAQSLRESQAEVILISGGSSVGPEDHAPGVLAELGELAIHGVALRPASPTGIGFLGGRPVFLLPGNPVSCLAAYDFFAGPAIRALGGRSTDWPYRRLNARLAAKVASAVGRVDYVRVQVTAEGVVPLATSGASILSSTTRADAFLIVPAESEGYPEGTAVEVYLYDS